jgi:hypothetical protein
VDDVGVDDDALLDGGELGDVWSLDPDSGSPVDAGPSPASLDAPLEDLATGRRSFFAQPDPLKWTAGAANALRIGPDPHSGQLVGGSAWTPWITSNRRPHAAQS